MTRDIMVPTAYPPQRHLSGRIPVISGIRLVIVVVAVYLEGHE